jgi:hypothetical protein
MIKLNREDKSLYDHPGGYVFDSEPNFERTPQPKKTKYQAILPRIDSKPRQLKMPPLRSNEDAPYVDKLNKDFLQENKEYQ